MKIQHSQTNHKKELVKLSLAHQDIITLFSHMPSQGTNC